VEVKYMVIITKDRKEKMTIWYQRLLNLPKILIKMI
jgi:hypothetical protein